MRSDLAIFLVEIYSPLHEERNHLVGLVEDEGYYHLVRSVIVGGEKL